MQAGNLTASNLKDALWVTLNQVKAKRMLPGHADAVASQAREILRTVKSSLWSADKPIARCQPKLSSSRKERIGAPRGYGNE
jgi:hypothetical protein